MSNIINHYHLIAYVADGFIRARKPAKWAAGESGEAERRLGVSKTRGWGRGLARGKG